MGANQFRILNVQIALCSLEPEGCLHCRMVGEVHRENGCLDHFQIAVDLVQLVSVLMGVPISLKSRVQLVSGEELLNVSHPEVEIAHDNHPRVSPLLEYCHNQVFEAVDALLHRIALVR